LEVLKMRIASPCIITSRLTPGIVIGGATIGIDYKTHCDVEYRTRYRWTIDLPNGEEFEGDDLMSGSGGGSLQEGLLSLLSFLGAAGEGLGYETRTGRKSDNSDLFPAAVVEWAAQNSDEIAAAQWELEEGQPVTIDEDSE